MAPHSTPTIWTCTGTRLCALQANRLGSRHQSAILVVCLALVLNFLLLLLIPVPFVCPFSLIAIIPFLHAPKVLNTNQPWAL
jgi:hypothetical protein